MKKYKLKYNNNKKYENTTIEYIFKYNKIKNYNIIK